MSSKIIYPAIVVVAFNREESLKRLLQSIKNALYFDYPPVSLIISIDGGGEESVKKIARDFEWAYGPKKVIIAEQNKGLRNHIISSGDLVNEYGSVIILEDDCLVSNDFYNYSVQALTYFNDDTYIAGISLYSYKFIENAPYPFCPLDEGFSNYFMQVPSSWGQAFTKNQWNKFRSFYNSNPTIGKSCQLPDNVKSWKASSWKKFFFKYLVDNNLFFVYPMHSLSTNFCDSGEHYDQPTNLFQVPITARKTGALYSFIKFENSFNIYDAYFEIFPTFFDTFSTHNANEIGVDLYGTKQLDLFNFKYVYSIKDCNNPLKSFGVDLKPLVQNIKNEIPGSNIQFGLKKDFTTVSKRTSDLLMHHADASGYEYAYNAGYGNGRIAGIKFIQGSKIYKAGYFLLYPFLLLKNIFLKYKNN